MLIPVGGGDPGSWPDRLLGLELAEFHLYDREQIPEIYIRFAGGLLSESTPVPATTAP